MFAACDNIVVIIVTMKRKVQLVRKTLSWSSCSKKLSFFGDVQMPLDKT